MFLGIDLQKAEHIAVKDNEGNILTYGKLSNEIRELSAHVQARAVIFCLCKNTVGSLLGYLAFVEADAVPLMLSSKIDKGLLKKLLETYTPAYIWCPTEMKDSLEA